jgi:hypothetical protein
VVASVDLESIDIYAETAQIDVTSFGDPRYTYVPGSTDYRIDARPRKLTVCPGRSFQEALSHLGNAGPGSH